MDLMLSCIDRRHPPSFARSVWIAEHPRGASRRSPDPRGSQARGSIDAPGNWWVTPRKYVVTTQSDPDAANPSIWVSYAADAPDRLWVADMTLHPDRSGWLYLAMVLDVYSRKIVGWAMDTNMRTELILDALQMAVTQRQPKSVIHHSDRGSASTPAPPSASAVRSRHHAVDGSGGRRLRQRDGRELSPRSSARCSTAEGSKARPKHAWLSLSGSRVGTTCIAVTPGWVTAHLSISSGRIIKPEQEWQSFCRLLRQTHCRVRSTRQHENKITGLRH
ncbi:MAG: DDE-type integrase/transposase/recombinase [Steroidobacteraceae bacterium]